jgi:hypothetical protein
MAWAIASAVYPFASTQSQPLSAASGRLATVQRRASLIK